MNGINVTYLVTPRPMHAGKTFVPNGKPIAMPPCAEWAWKVREYGTTDDFFAGIRTAAETRRAIIIRGTPIDNAPAIINRRKNMHDGVQPHIRNDLGTRWLCLDFDFKLKQEAKDAWDLESYDDQVTTIKEEITARINKKLPEWLLRSKKLIHLSSSFFITKAGFHVWLVLDRALGNDDLKRIAADCGSDPAVMNEVQPHFIADPIFTGGVKNPLEGHNRWFVLDGEEFAIAPSKYTDFKAPAKSSLPDAPMIYIESSTGWSLTGESYMKDMEAEAYATGDGNRDAMSWSQLIAIRGFIRKGQLDASAIDAWAAWWSRNNRSPQEIQHAIVNAFKGYALQEG